MKQSLRYILALFGVAFVLAGPVFAVATPTPVSAACDSRILGIPPWYRGVVDSNCDIVSPTGTAEIQAFITKIVLNGIEMAMVITAYLAAFFIMYGAFQFIANNGSSDTVAKAIKTIINALIGLVVSLGGVAILNLVFGVVDTTAPINGINVPQADADVVLRNVLNTAYFVAGIIAVIVIVIAGINYSLSAGDSGKLTKARNQIIYSVVGIVILLSAFGITNFIIGRF